MRLPAVPGEFAHHEEPHRTNVLDLDDHLAMLWP